DTQDNGTFWGPLLVIERPAQRPDTIIHAYRPLQVSGSVIGSNANPRQKGTCGSQDGVTSHIAPPAPPAV
ncbi:hypothetical protein PoB_004810900, partial [Plakobranchus ocellatus]